MSAAQVENILKLIDSNFNMQRDEARKYLKAHRSEILEQLKRNGQFEIPSPAGPVVITKKELEREIEAA